MRALHTPSEAVQWLHERVSSGSLSVDSRSIHHGDGFIAWPGAATDGRDFVKEVLRLGAVACLVESEGAANWSWVNDEHVGLYVGLKKDLAKIAALYYGHPSKQMSILAVTGTNGKTSSSWWLAHALTALNHPCGVVGTLGVGTLDALEYSGLTTPDPVRLQRALRGMCDQGVTACAIEASSIGLEEHRFDDVYVKVALLTNVTQDHLDYHKTMEAYWQAKRRLFDWPGVEAIVVNLDDEHGQKLVQELREKNDPRKIITYAVIDAADMSAKSATLEARNLHHLPDGVAFELFEGTESISVQLKLLGVYNVSNILGVIGAIRALDYSLEQAVMACEGLGAVPGRLQSVFTLKQEGCKVLVDYAHTPDALESVLKTLRPLAQARKGKLWCVFGCGGDRDSRKRPLMGRAVQTWADQVVLTSDNPRTENPDQIIEDTKAGMHINERVHIEADRRKAIHWTLSQADRKDVVLIAGKGHEWYQEVNGYHYPFLDVEVASQIIHSLETSESDTQEMMTVQQAKELLESQGVPVRLYGDGNTGFARVHTDTRSLSAGDLFVALRGENFDGHAFLVQACDEEASAVLAERGVENLKMPGLGVADSLQALNALGKGWRACHSLPVIGVTGSNGKTTTTQMIASILKVWLGERALATQGNLNNNIGVPLSVLRLRKHHRAAVFELGMNHPGEIARLAQVVSPTIGLVNNAQREHLEFMETVEAVARENGQVIDALPLEGIAVLPADDEYTPLWKKMAHERQVVTFALDSESADYTANYQWKESAWVMHVRTPKGEFVCHLNSAGVHNVKNALAAVACAQQAGAPLEKISEGLNLFKPVKGRSQVLLLRFGAHQLTLIDDTYNANPDSVRAAIDVLADLPAPSVFILGDMGEVGSQGNAFHDEIGRYARQKGISGLWGTGALSKKAIEAFGDEGGRAHYFANTDDIADALLKKVGSYSSVLIKGSRFMKMERVVERLQSAAEQAGGHYVA